MSEKFQRSGWYDIHFQVTVTRDSLVPYGKYVKVIKKCDTEIIPRIFSFSALLTTWCEDTGSQVKPIRKTEGDRFASNIGHIDRSSDVVLRGHAISMILANDHLELLIRTPTKAGLDIKQSIYISALFLRDSSKLR